LKKRRQEEEERRKREELAWNRLRQIGVYVAGFRWIKQDGRYRCVGKSY
jgi:hypothetical protein